jgi:hypothetical protein
MADDSVSYQVVVLTTRHSITGDLLFRDQRLSDFLNDRRDTVISFRNVQIARLTEPGKVLQKHPAAVVPKSWVAVAFEPPQKAIPQEKRFYGYVRKQEQPVFMMLEGMEIRGVLHTAGDLDLRRVLAGGVGEMFLPITKAVVTLFPKERYVIEQQAIMVNSTLVRYIAKIEGTPETLSAH